MDIAGQMAAALVRKHWKTVAAVAEKLVFVGHIEGDDEILAGLERLDRSLLEGEFAYLRKVNLAI